MLKVKDDLESALIGLVFVHLLNVWLGCMSSSYGQYAFGMNAIKILSLCHDEDRLRFHLIGNWRNEEWLFWTVMVRKTSSAA